MRLLAVIATVISTHDDAYFHRGIVKVYQRETMREHWFVTKHQTKAKTVQTVISLSNKSLSLSLSQTGGTREHSG